MKKNSELLLRRLTVTGMMIALEIVLSRYASISFPTFKIGFYFLPMTIVAILYGPIYSSIAWGLTDIIGAMLFPTGSFFFGFTISAVLNGLIFGIFLYKNHTKIQRVLLAVGIASTLISVGCDTVWLIMYFAIISVNKLPIAILTDRIIRSAVMIPVEVVTIAATGKLLSDFLYRNSTVYYEKKELRREAQSYYKGEFAKERDSISDNILEQLIELDDYKSAEKIFCYIGRDNEVNTSKIIARALSDGKTVAVPLCSQKGVMTARVISDLNDLTIGKFGILEPNEESSIIPRDDIQLAVIPTLLSDKKGRRVGFGGGYYDRYLFKSQMVKIILCPAKMVKNKLPSTSFDVRGDLVLYER